MKLNRFSNIKASDYIIDFASFDDKKFINENYSRKEPTEISRDKYYYYLENYVNVSFNEDEIKAIEDEFEEFWYCVGYRWMGTMWRKVNHHPYDRVDYFKIFNVKGLGEVKVEYDISKLEDDWYLVTIEYYFQSWKKWGGTSDYKMYLCDELESLLTAIHNHKQYMQNSENFKKIDESASFEPKDVHEILDMVQKYRKTEISREDIEYLRKSIPSNDGWKIEMSESEFTIEMSYMCPEKLSVTKFRVSKLNDDWWFVIEMDSITFWLCDQLEGVVDFMKTISKQ